MNTTTNIALNVIGAGLIAIGANSISTNLLSGAVEIVLGILVYAVYELAPSK